MPISTTLRNYVVGEPRSPLNLPTTLTIARMFFAPLLVVVLLSDFDGRHAVGVPRELIAAAIFGLAAVTDWLDGYLARRRHQVTTLGQMLDPVADKVLTIAVFAALVQLGVAPAWMVALIVGRECAVTILRSVAQRKGVTIPASGWGKAKMVSQVVAIQLLILGSGPLPSLAMAGTVALWVALMAAMFSGHDYYARYQRVLGGRSAPLPETQRAI